MDLMGHRQATFFFMLLTPYPSDWYQISSTLLHKTLRISTDVSDGHVYLRRRFIRRGKGRSRLACMMFLRPCKNFALLLER